MSKASEWAKTRKKFERSPSCRLGDLTLSIVPPSKKLGVRLSVRTAFTVRVNNRVSPARALRVARWILDTFEEKP
jgi:hypothetical protein